MCRTCGKRHNSYLIDPSSAGGPLDGSLDTASGSISYPFGLRSTGKASPLLGRNLKEYEEELEQLKKENFALKLRIYFLEERMGFKKGVKEDKNLYQANIELQVESEALKKELCEKQELVRQASAFFSTLENRFKEQLEQAKEQHEKETLDLRAKVALLQKEVDEGKNLTQLCGLAFSTEEGNVPVSGVLSSQQCTQGYKVPNIAGMGSSPMQGVLSLPSEVVPSMVMDPNAAGGGRVPQSSSNRIKELEEEVEHLQRKVTDMEQELGEKERISRALEEDVGNLRKELEDKEEKLTDLEQEVVEKDQKVDQLMQDLETRHREIEAKDSTIQTLHDDLNKVEPEIEIKIQEIIEKDRIIEEKIEQLQQQNKILVEIQITLDEKQKQITELEATLLETQQKAEKLSKDFEFSCETIKSFVCEVMTRDKEIAALKKEVKKKDKKVRDLVAELKETLDMLKKAKWESETSGGEDGVKEMVEEENERLWAELEQKKLEILALESRKDEALKEAALKMDELKRRLEENELKLKSLELQLNESRGRNEGRISGEETAYGNDADVTNLKERLEARDSLLKNQQNMIDSLREDLLKAKEELREKREEMKEIKKELSGRNADVQDIITKELFGRNKEIRDLQGKLCSLSLEKDGQISLDAIKLFLEAQHVEPNPKDHAGKTSPQLRSNSLSQLNQELTHNAESKDGASSQFSAKPGRSNSFSLLENALYAQMGQKVYNTNQTFNTYVLPGENDRKQSFSEATPLLSTADLQKEISATDHINECEAKAMLSNILSRERRNNLSSDSTTADVKSDSTEVEFEISQPGIINNSAVQLFCQELSKIKREADDLRNERDSLKEQLISFQQKKDYDYQTMNIMQEPDNMSVEAVSLKKLEDPKEERIVNRVNKRAVTDLQGQVEYLKDELQGTKSKVTLQMLEVASCKYHESLKYYKQEIISLRKRLVDSHNACDLLRSRLEELVDFMEQILEMDKKGVINLSYLSVSDRLSLQKTLNDSRSLSHSLSHSLMIGTESTVGEDELSTNINSRFSLPLNDIPEEIDLTKLNFSLAADKIPFDYIEETSLNTSFIDPTHPDFMYHSFAAQISSLIDSKTQEIDSIAARFGQLGSVMQERDDQVKTQTSKIAKLQAELEKLKGELIVKDQLLTQVDENLVYQKRNKHCSSDPVSAPVLCNSSVQNIFDPSLHLPALQQSVPEAECMKGMFTLSAKNSDNSSSSDTLPPFSLFFSSQEERRSIKSNEEPTKKHTLKENMNLSGMSNVCSTYSPDGAVMSLTHRDDLQNNEKLESILAHGSPLDGGISLEQPSVPPSFALASPSESEAWSEPDRNVSLARIGLDTCNLISISHDRSMSRSRMTRSAPFTSESEGEAPPEETREGSAGQGTPSAKPKRRSDAAEVKRLTSKLRNQEQLNETLRAELHIYQTVNQKLEKKTLVNKSCSKMPCTSDKSVETQHENDTYSGDLLATLTPYLQEIRSLRIKLEEDIIKNDLLRDQLEAALAGYWNEETRNLTTKLTTAQQEIKLCEEKLIAGAGTEEQLRMTCRENENKAFELSERLAEYMTTSQQLEQKLSRLAEELKEAKENLITAEEELNKLKSLKQETEEELGTKITNIRIMESEISSLKMELHKVRIEAEEKECKISSQTARIKSLEKEQGKHENHILKVDCSSKEVISSREEIRQSVSDQIIKRLEDALQEKENKLLAVIKDRFALMAESKRLKAQLASVSTFNNLLQRDLREMSSSKENSPSDEILSLTAAKAKIKNLQTEKERFLGDKDAMQKELMLLEVQVSTPESKNSGNLLSMFSKNNSKEAEELVRLYDSYKILEDKHASLREKLSTLQIDCSALEGSQRLLQEKYLVAEEKYSSLKEKYDLLFSEKRELEDSKASQDREVDRLIRKLNEQERICQEITSQLDAERCLTGNLQLQINILQMQMNKNSYDSTSESQELPSPGSAASIDTDFTHSDLKLSTTQTGLKTDHHGTGRNICSYSKRKGPFHPLAVSWNEDKENHLPISRKHLSLPNFDDGVMSGESPDLGIGSDGHCSSVEKIYSCQELVEIHKQDYNVLEDKGTKLCSIPRHSQLFSENERLRHDRNHLRSELASVKHTLQETSDQLVKANARKEAVERAIYKQLTKTHTVLKKASGNLREAKYQQALKKATHSKGDDPPEKSS